MPRGGMSPGPHHRWLRSAIALVTSPFVWGIAYRYLLPIWFILQSAKLLIGLALDRPSALLGVDARIYYEAGLAWLQGGDPWNVPVDGFTFAAPPPTLLAVIPFLPFGQFGTAFAWVLGSALIAVWLLRRLKLPLWWLAFPPLLEAISGRELQCRGSRPPRGGPTMGGQPGLDAEDLRHRPGLPPRALAGTARCVCGVDRHHSLSAVARVHRQGGRYRQCCRNKLREAGARWHFRFSFRP